MQTEVNVTEVKQDANELLNLPKKTLYYLIIGEPEDRVIISIGDKNYTKLKELLNL